MNRRLGRYQILDEIARGGQGVVYRARVQGLERDVALKLLLGSQSPKQRKRFLREAKALARLRHPNLVEIYDVGEVDGQLYMALEWVPGDSLQGRLDREGSLPVSDALEIVRGVSAAIGHAHAHRLLHRDLKPANVLLGRDGKPRVTDFGLTRDLVQLAQTQLTQTGQFLGTPGYWAPEQARGQKALQGPATDVWGLGALLYAALTGSPPGVGDSLVELLAQLDQPVVPPSQRNPSVPRWLDNVTLRALANHPQDRWPTAEALAAALEGPAAPARAPLVAGLVLLAGFFLAGAVLLARGFLQPGGAATGSAHEAALTSTRGPGPEPTLSPTTPAAEARPETSATPATEAQPGATAEQDLEPIYALLARGPDSRQAALAALDALLAQTPQHIDARLLRLLTRIDVTSRPELRHMLSDGSPTRLRQEAVALRSALRPGDPRIPEVDLVVDLLQSYTLDADLTQETRDYRFARIQDSMQGGDLLNALYLVLTLLRSYPVGPAYLYVRGSVMRQQHEPDLALACLLLTRRCLALGDAAAPRVVTPSQLDDEIRELRRQGATGALYPSESMLVNQLHYDAWRLIRKPSRVDECVSMINQAASLEPDNPEIVLARAIIRLALRSNGWESGPPAWSLTETLISLRRLQGALPAADPRRPEVELLLELGEAYRPWDAEAEPGASSAEFSSVYAQGDYEAALAINARLLASFPVQPTYLRDRGYALLGLERKREALAYCLLAKRCSPVDPAIGGPSYDRALIELKRIIAQLRR